MDTQCANVRIIDSKKPSRKITKPTRNLYQDIVLSAPNAIICVSPTGRITEWNRRAEEIFGISRAEVLGSDFLETCFSNQERFRMNCEIQLLKNGETAADLRSFLTLPDGREITLSWDISVFSIENGVRYVAVARELPERWREEGRIRFNPYFNDTVDLVLSSLGAIMERIECINARMTPETLERLRESYDDGQIGRRIPAKTAAAVERLILGVMGEHRQVS